MLRAPPAPWVTYHNVVGMIPTRRWFSSPQITGDGVVEYDSAHMDDVDSEVIVAPSTRRFIAIHAPSWRRRILQLHLIRFNRSTGSPA